MLVRLIAAVALLMASSAPATAHTRSQSMSSLSVQGETVIVAFRTTAREVTRLSVLQPQAETLPELLATHLVSTLSVSRGGSECPLLTAPILQQAEAADVAMELQFDCGSAPADGVVEFAMEAFFPVASTHIHFARARSPAGFEEVLLTDTSRTATFAFDSEGVSVPVVETALETLGRYVALGVEHILEGLDHLAFLLGLLLLCRRLRDVVFVVTGFTIGHSITLSLAVLGIAAPDTAVVEALIAFTILVVAAEAILAPRLRGDVALASAGLLAGCAFLAALIGSALGAGVWIGLALLAGGYLYLVKDEGLARRLLPGLTMVFGMIHGFGFASVLLDLGLPPGRLALALFGFNAGVELGQLMLVAVAWSLAALTAPRLAGEHRPMVRVGLAAALCFGGSYWLALRAFA